MHRHPVRLRFRLLKMAYSGELGNEAKFIVGKLNLTNSTPLLWACKINVHVVCSGPHIEKRIV